MPLIQQPLTQLTIPILTSLFQTRNQTKSYIFILISCFTWVCGFIYANEHRFTPIETNLSRSIVIVVGSYGLCRVMGISIEYKSRKTFNTLLKRHLAFILQGFVIAGAQFFLPLSILHTIATAGPIFTLVMQKLLYKTAQNPITRKKLITCIIVIFGILLTSNGKFIYTYFDQSFDFSTSFENYASRSYLVMFGTTLVLVVTLFIWSYGVLITQQAECHAFAIVLHFGVMNLVANGVAYFLIVDKRPASEMYQSLFWVGLLLFMAEISFTLGLNTAENIGLTMVTGFTVVVVGYGVSILRYGESVDIVSLVGTFMVLFGVGSIILAKDTVKTDQNDNNSKEKSEEMSQLQSQIK